MAAYRRVLLKLSGEVLAGERGVGIDAARLEAMASAVAEALQATGATAGIVIGGGNIFRGLSGAARGMDRPTGDAIGMLATVMNALSFQDALRRLGVAAAAMSAVRMEQVCEPYVRARALAHLQQGRIVLLAGGTGLPYFSTDSAAALRAAELGADALLKATKVDGIYDRDPVAAGGAARRFVRLGYEEFLTRNLKVMDATAVALCRDNRIPVRVFALQVPGQLQRAVAGEGVGSLLTDGPTEFDSERQSG